MFAHEAKGDATTKPKDVIVAAFGNQKCPKLIEQVMSEHAVTRRNALAVLCDELRNPLSVQGCVEAGMVPVLNTYISKSEDPATKDRASRALAVCAMDAIGRESMLEHGSAYEVYTAIEDQNVKVRFNVYEAMVNFTKGTLPCLASVIEAEYPKALVAKAASESPSVQPLVLKLMYNVIRSQLGLDDTLGSGGVPTCIELLESKEETVRKEAATTLCFLCFTESAKQAAIKDGAVSILCRLMADSAWEVRSAATGALVAVTTTDEGKMALVPAGGAEAMMEVLRTAYQRSLKLNVLKLVSNAAVHPEVRAALREDERVLPTLDDYELGDDTLIAKHATIAKAAVLWQP